MVPLCPTKNISNEEYFKYREILDKKFPPLATFLFLCDVTMLTEPKE